MKKILLAVALVFTSVLLLTGCTEKKNTNPLVGSWEYSSSFIYTFNEDKTGTYKAGSTNMEFTWEVDGNKLSILYKGNTTAFETEYKIENDVLTIKDSFDNDVKYSKKK